MERPYDRRTGSSEEPWTDEDPGQLSRGGLPEGEGSEGEAREAARQQASEYAEQGREKAVSQLATQKERASGELSGVARALRATGDQLEEQRQDSIARYANRAADQTGRLAEYLSEREADELVGEVEDFARSRPAVFLGGAFVAGVAAARFLRSSAGRREAVDLDVGSAVNDPETSAVRVGEENRR